MSASRNTALTAAWQDALAAEHEAVFGYTLLGPQLTGAAQQLAVACSNAHESLRDATEQAMWQAGLTPVSPRADYPGLYPVPDAASARRLAARLEQGCAAAWRFLYAQAASAPGPAATARRAEAQAALTASAVRATKWRLLIDPHDATTAFPGI
ncbi:MAG TPA: DUF4439 domain-containing protein [Jatrophihabitans sp.]|nr:DUF4439 domain-containing protein [Jatrophihabitans sp.]